MNYNILMTSDSKNNIDSVIEYAKNLGVKVFNIEEMNGEPDNKEKYELTSTASIEDICEAVLALKGFNKVKSLLGYKYLNSCVLIMYDAIKENEDLMECDIHVCKSVYLDAARIHNTSWNCIEKNIRTVVKRCMSVPLSNKTVLFSLAKEMDRIVKGER